MEISENPRSDSLDIREATRRDLLRRCHPSSRSSSSSRKSWDDHLLLPPPSPFDYNFAGLEVCQDEFQGLEVYTEPSENKQVLDNAEEKVLRCSDNGGKEVFDTDSVGKEVLKPEYPTERRGKRFCRLTNRSIALLATLLLGVVGLALGLGVGFGLGHSTGVPQQSENSPSSLYEIGGAIDPSYYSKKGAFNGSGIGIATEWSELYDAQRGLFLYYQHFTGEIRWMKWYLNGTWAPIMNGTTPYAIATDAKNATPISIVSYGLNNTGTTHLFYINRDNFVRQLTYTNISDVWEPGPFDQLNVTALDAGLVGLEACWFTNIYSDSAYYNNGSDASIQADTGINLWVAIDNSTFNQYLYINTESQWTERPSWNNYNGHSGVSCFTWGPTNTSYVMLEDLDNNIEIWWKDTRPGQPSLENHPINVWQNATGAVMPNVFPSSSIFFMNYLFAQYPNGGITGYNVSFEAENTTFVSNLVPSGGPTGQPNQIPFGILGSHILVTAVPNEDGTNNQTLFYQTEGDDITMATYSLVLEAPVLVNPWNFTKLPIPDT